MKSMILLSILLLLNGCALLKPSPKRITMDTSQHAPVRIHISQPIQAEDLKRILLIPPMGDISAEIQEQLHRRLFSSAQRHFMTPIRTVSADSAYAPYIAENNLMASDGTLNLQEIVILGRLMNTTHVMCPFILEARPYHPQRINIHITVIDITTAEAPVELSAVFDASEEDIRDTFYEFAKMHKRGDEIKKDLELQIHSPAMFQAFATDVLCNVLAEKLPF
jgi:hypothetical protein